MDGEAVTAAATTPGARFFAARRLALTLMVASGCAALGYQIVWTQQSTLWLGHEAAAVLAVVTAFFGGLGVGALALGPRVDRSARPAVWYAACEAIIGLWSLALAFLLEPVASRMLTLIGPQPTATWHWTIAFCGTFLLLLPATVSMGATLPAMERTLARLRGEGTSVAALYAGNTFGALLGVLASAFVLVPNLGLTRTAAACAVLNLFCAVVAWKLFGGDHARSGSRQPSGAPGVLRLLTVTGLLGIGYEVLVVRVLSQVAENTVYTFAILLAVYLVGTALGAAIYGRRPFRADDAPAVRDRLLTWLAASCLLGMLSLALAKETRNGTLDLLGHSMGASLAAEVVLAVAAFLPPTLLMGALFSHLGTQARMAGVDLGRALGVNTLGAALAPPLFGVLLVPAMGARSALLVVVAGYLLLAARRGPTRPAWWASAVAAACTAAWLPSLAIVDVPAGGRLVSYAEGVMSAVSVVEDAGGVATLHINSRQQEGSSATLFADARQALLPILLHPGPRHALFLGLGTGVTAHAATRDPALQVDVVELLPEVVAASARFVTPRQDGSAGDTRLHVMVADARRFVRATDRHYDVIVSDNFHPARSGSGALYTVEHFRAVRARLAPGGLFCQWLPLHQLDLQTLRNIVAAFLAAYPDAWAMLATNSLDTPTIGLVARGDGQRLDLDRIRTRLGDATPAVAQADFGIVDDLALLGSFIAGPRALATFAGDARVNSDDLPVVIYGAPRVTYAPDSLPRDRLVALLHAVEISPDELLADPYERAWAARLSAYQLARNRFIEAGLKVRPTADVSNMLTQVREPLLSVLRTSPDFRPAYDPLLNMALALSRRDLAGARNLLTELQQLQPARPEAAMALRALAGPAP